MTPPVNASFVLHYYYTSSMSRLRDLVNGLHFNFHRFSNVSFWVRNKATQTRGPSETHWCTPQRNILHPEFHYQAILQQYMCHTLINETKKITTNHEIPSPATAGQLQAAALSVHMSYQSAGTVPLRIRLVFPSTKQCCVVVIKVSSSAKEWWPKRLL